MSSSTIYIGASGNNGSIPNDNLNFQIKFKSSLTVPIYTDNLYVGTSSSGFSSYSIISYNNPIIIYDSLRGNVLNTVYSSYLNLKNVSFVSQSWSFVGWIYSNAITNQYINIQFFKFNNIIINLTSTFNNYTNVDIGINNTSAGSSYNFSPAINNNQWYHIVLSYNVLNNNITLYINGIQLSQTIKNLQTNIGLADVSLGDTGNNISNNLLYFDNIRLYNRILSADEIWLIYNSEYYSIQGTSNYFQGNIYYASIFNRAMTSYEITQYNSIINTPSNINPATSPSALIILSSQYIYPKNYSSVNGSLFIDNLGTSSVVFNGSSHSILFPSQNIIWSNGFSIVLQIKINSLPTGNSSPLYISNLNVFAASYGFYINISSSSILSFYFIINGVTTQYGTYIFNLNQIYNIVYNYTFSSGTSGTVTLYVDGILINTITTSVLPTSVLTYSYVYSSTNLYSLNYFNGAIYYLAFYNTTLTTSQVNNFYPLTYNNQSTTLSILGNNSDLSTQFISGNPVLSLTPSGIYPQIVNNYTYYPALDNTNLMNYSFNTLKYNYYLFQPITLTLSSGFSVIAQLSFSASNSNTICMFAQSTTSPVANYISLQHNNTTNVSLVYCGSTSTSTQSINVSTLSLNTVYNIAFTYNGSTTNVYVNGLTTNTSTSISVTQTPSNSTSSTTYNSYVGCSSSGLTIPTSFFSGNIYHLSVYNKVLSSIDIGNFNNMQLNYTQIAPTIPFKSSYFYQSITNSPLYLYFDADTLNTYDGLSNGQYIKAWTNLGQEGGTGLNAIGNQFGTVTTLPQLLQYRSQNNNRYYVQISGTGTSAGGNYFNLPNLTFNYQNPSNTGGTNGFTIIIVASIPVNVNSSIMEFQETSTLIASSTDANFSSVTLLSHSSSTADSSNYATTLTMVGTVTYTMGFFAKSSAFNISTNNYLTTPSATQYTIGSNNFTIEFWFYLPSLAGSTNRFIGNVLSGYTTNNWSIGMLSAGGSLIGFGAYNYTNGATTWLLSGTTNVVAGTWYFYTVVRNGNTFSQYINGRLDVSSTAFTGSIDAGTGSNTLFIGAATSGALTGYMGEIRVTVGVARYTANFTVPIGVFPPITINNTLSVYGSTKLNFDYIYNNTYSSSITNIDNTLRIYAIRFTASGTYQIFYNSGINNGTTLIDTGTLSLDVNRTYVSNFIGRFNNTNGSYGNLALGELLVYRSALPDASINAVMATMQNRWNIDSASQNIVNTQNTNNIGTNFNPRTSLSATTTCALWLDAADMTTLTFTTSGIGGYDGISAWTDKSVNAVSFGSPAATNYPYYKTNALNNKPGVYFAGNQTISTASFGGGTAAFTFVTGHTFFMVISSTQGGGLLAKNTSNATPTAYSAVGHRVYWLGDGFSSLLISAGLSGLFPSFVGFNSQLTLTNTPISSYGSNQNGYVLCFKYVSATTLAFYVNGIQIGTVANVLTLGSGTDPAGQLWFGNAISGIFGSTIINYFTGNMHEIIFYNTSLSDNDRTIVNNYLMNKWGIQSGGVTQLENTGQLTSANLYNFAYLPFQFTNAGTYGRNGPTTYSLQGAYSSSSYGVWTNNIKFLKALNGIQSWTVPITGLYEFILGGASGGYVSIPNAGKGIVIIGKYYLYQGQVLEILVGQPGYAIYQNSTNATNTTGGTIIGGSGSSGGGGTFVALNGELLFAAGGGGGTGWNTTTEVGSAYSNGTLTPISNPGANSSNTATVSSGVGGNGGAGTNLAGGGGGFLGNGKGNGGGYSFTNGGNGGYNTYVNTAITGNPNIISSGGFGGGGAATVGASGSSSSGGGGGGYSGGGSGGSSGPGGGGGSYDINSLNNVATLYSGFIPGSSSYIYIPISITAVAVTTNVVTFSIVSGGPNLYVGLPVMISATISNIIPGLYYIYTVLGTTTCTLSNSPTLNTVFVISSSVTATVSAIIFFQNIIITLTATFANTNYITVSSTQNLYVGQSLYTTGSTFGNIATTTVYYIYSIVNLTTITLSSANTLASQLVVTTTTGTMTGTLISGINGGYNIGPGFVSISMINQTANLLTSYPLQSLPLGINSTNSIIKQNIVYPLDQLNYLSRAAACGIYSLRLLTSTYSGPLVQLRRDTDNAILDFYGNFAGILTSLKGQNITDWSSNTFAYVVKWYDQSGCNNHAYQYTYTMQPILNYIVGQVDFKFSRWLQLPLSTVPTANSQYTTIIRHNTVGFGIPTTSNAPTFINSGTQTIPPTAAVAVSNNMVYWNISSTGAYQDIWGTTQSVAVTTFTISATTITTNVITVSSTSGLAQGVTVLISGTAIGNLIAGFYTINSVLSTTTLTFTNFIVTTAGTGGTMTANITSYLPNNVVSYVYDNFYRYVYLNSRSAVAPLASSSHANYFNSTNASGGLNYNAIGAGGGSYLNGELYNVCIFNIALLNSERNIMENIPYGNIITNYNSDSYYKNVNLLLLTDTKNIYTSSLINPTLLDNSQYQLKLTNANVTGNIRINNTYNIFGGGNSSLFFDGTATNYINATIT